MRLPSKPSPLTLCWLDHLAHMRGEDYSDAVDAFWNGAPTKGIANKKKKGNG